MNVLSLFDGMSCGQIALNNAGFKIKKYFAAEIDKHSIQVTQANYPDTIQLGDVSFITGQQFNGVGGIDLLIGGSPCQGFSFAGKQLNFEDERSKLFFEYVRILNELREFNPNIKFLLENVNMKKEYLRVISEYLGVFTVRINSNLVSAQNRDRWYWSNIRTKDVGLFAEKWTDIPQPEDRGIFLKDILQPEEEIDKKYHIKHDVINGIKNWKSTSNPLQTIIGPQNKTRCATARGIGEMHSDMQLIKVNDTIRRLTPMEVERLQTVPDKYSDIVIDRHRYKMLGNGWTISVIEHIFKYLKP